MSTRRHRRQKRLNICGFYDFQESIGSITLQTPYFSGGVEESKTFVARKLFNGSLIKSFFPFNHEVLAILKKQKPHDAPKIIDEVGIKEKHAPARLRRRKAAEEEPLRIWGKKRLERMSFDGKY